MKVQRLIKTAFIAGVLNIGFTAQANIAVMTTPEIKATTVYAVNTTTQPVKNIKPNYLPPNSIANRHHPGSYGRRR